MSSLPADLPLPLIGRMVILVPSLIMLVAPSTTVEEETQNTIGSHKPFRYKIMHLLLICYKASVICEITWCSYNSLGRIRGQIPLAYSKETI